MSFVPYSLQIIFSLQQSNHRGKWFKAGWGESVTIRKHKVKLGLNSFFQFLYMSCSRLSYPNHSTLLVLKFQVQSFKKKVSSSNNIINMHFSLILIILLYLILIRELSNALFLCLIEHVYIPYRFSKTYKIIDIRTFCRSIAQWVESKVFHVHAKFAKYSYSFVILLPNIVV